MNAFERHFVNVMSYYSSTMVVNLLGSKEGEQTLSRAFQEVHRLSSFSGIIPHLAFDYHSEFRAGGEKSLESLIQRLDQSVSQWGYFYAQDGRTELCQTGVLRVNCVDCLDRTNSVQTLVGMELVLPRMLDQLAKSTANQSIVHHRFVDSMRRTWQLNGDRISHIYVGTGALGCGRSLRLKDVRRSAARTIQHNFFDSAKHKAMCHLLSNCSVHGWMQHFIDQYIPHRLQHLPPPMLTTLMSRHEEFVEKHPLRIFVGTWNVNGGKRFRTLAHREYSVANWLLDLHRTVDDQNNWGFVNPGYTTQASLDRPMDIFAVGFEEIVDLTTSNIVAGAKASANQQSWGNLLLRHLNRRQHPRDAYLLITSVQLVGVCLYLFVRARLAHHLREISTTSVKTGLSGAAGNKGAVAIRFQLAATSVCIVCSHFAAGQSAVQERNDDFNEICHRLRLSNGRSLFCHDYVFWCGDFNYRINLPAADVKRLVVQRDWSRLLEHDQLTLERRSQTVFRGFKEGPIRFAPTYKYDLFCNDYDTSEKARSPAWTDRVLWRRTLLRSPILDMNGVSVKPPSEDSDLHWSACRLVVYNRCELRSSDHRPVGAIFDVDFYVISRDVRYRVILDVARKYDYATSSVLLTTSMVECQSQQPVLDKLASDAVYDRFQFLENLKVICQVEKTTILCVCRLQLNEFLLVYSNPTQARQAAASLNGMVTSCTTVVPSARGACELHLTASVHSLAAYGELDSYDQQQFEMLVAVAERKDANVHQPLPSADIFEALPPFEQDVDVAAAAAEEGGAVHSDFAEELEEGQEDEDDLEESLPTTANIGGVTVPPPVPRRIAPPRPAPPFIGSSPPHPVAHAPQTNSLKSAPDRLVSSSANTSPVHGALLVHPLSPDQTSTRTTLLQTISGDPQLVNSCFDLSNSDQLAGLFASSASEISPQRTSSTAFLPSVDEMLSSLPCVQSYDPVNLPPSRILKPSKQDPFTLEESPTNDVQLPTTTIDLSIPVMIFDRIVPLRPPPPPPVPPRPDLD